LFGAFLTTAWPEPRAVQSIRGAPSRPANRQGFANPSCPAVPQDWHDPQIRRVGFRVSKNTPAVRRLPTWATHGPASHTEFSKSIHTIPAYSVYDMIVRVSRASQELGLLLMAHPRAFHSHPNCLGWPIQLRVRRKWRLTSDVLLAPAPLLRRGNACPTRPHYHRDGGGSVGWARQSLTAPSWLHEARIKPSSENARALIWA
jgi:hypothetical protein